MIPRFTDDGLLPYDVEATVEELLKSHLVTGEGVGLQDWDADWRRTLVLNAGIIARRFWDAGRVDEFWIDGSFVEAVARPGDIDAYYILPREQLADLRGWVMRLNALEGTELWTWEPRHRRRFPEARDQKLPFWGKYHVDVVRHSGGDCGITGPSDEPLSIAEAFRRQRLTFKRKGIVRLRLG